MKLIGQAEVSIDKKSRLAVPAKFRSVLEALELGAGWVCMPRGELLWLVPEAEFDRLSAGWGDSLTPDEEMEDLQRSLFGLSERVEMDAAGRVTLPRKHLDYTGVDGEVVVIGMGTYLEVHNRAGWQAEEKNRVAGLRAKMTSVSARRPQGGGPSSG